MKVKKTNAARILDEAHINYELKSYPVDPDHLDAVQCGRICRNAPRTGV